MRQRIVRGLVPSLVLVALTLLFFNQLALTDRILGRGDTYVYFYPYWDIRNEAFRAGELPLWTPDIFMGAPLLANPQLGAYYPLNWLTAPFNAPEAVRWSILLHILIAGGGAFALYRATFGKADSSPLPGLLAGIVYGFGGYLGSHVEQINQLQGLAWMPWLFYLLHRARMGKHPLVWGLLLAMGFALQLFTGHTQTVFISGVGLGIYALGLGFFMGDGSTGKRARWQPLLILAGASLLALILAIPQLLPTMELTGMSNRGGGFNAQQATSFSLPPTYIGRGLLPSYDGQLFGEYIAYVGVIGLGLALFGVLAKRHESSGKNRLRWIWGAIALVGLVFALGRFNPLYLILAELPGFNFFRVPARWLALFGLAAAMLAGCGMTRLLGAREIAWRRWGIIGAGILILMLLTRFVFNINPEDMTGSAVPTTITLMGWGAALLVLAGFVVLRRLRIGALVVLAVTVELFAAAQILPYNDLVPPDVYYGQRFTISQMQAYAQAENPPGRTLAISDLLFDPGDRARLEARYQREGLNERAVRQAFIATKRQEVLYPNLPLTWGIPSVDGFGGGVLPTVHYTQFTSLALPPDTLRSIDGRLVEVLSRPECRGACLPDPRWLLQTNTQYLITDKVYDLVRDGVFYDTQIPYHAFAGEQREWILPDVFQATAVDVLYEGDSPPDLFLIDDQRGRPEFEASPGESLDGLQFARYELTTPANVSQVYLTPETDAVFYAVTLVDGRTGAFQQLTPLGWRRVLSSDIKIYENLLVRSRAFVAGDMLQLPDDWDGSEAALRLMADPAFDPRWRVIVHGEPPSFEGRSGFRAEPEFTHYDATRVEMTTTQDFEGYLLLQDAWYPGWKATVNGEPAPIYRANVMFRAVYVPAGESQITFTFEPDLWYGALGMGAAAWVTTLLLLLVRLRRVRSQSPQAHDPVSNSDRSNFEVVHK